MRGIPVIPKGGEVGVEFLHGMLSALVEEVRQLRGAVQALEQRLGEPGSMQAPSVTGNTDLVSVDGDIPAASMKAQMEGAVPPYDTSKYRLGRLCPRGHDYHGTGQSLRKNNKSGGCRACDVEQKREKRQAKRQALEAPSA